VSPPGDFGDELGHRVGDPTQHEKSAPHSEFVQEIECPPGVRVHPGFEPVPLTSLNESVEGPDLEVVFHGHGYEVPLVGLLDWFHALVFEGETTPRSCVDTS
jgi:hypothetical protein